MAVQAYRQQQQQQQQQQFCSMVGLTGEGSTWLCVYDGLTKTLGNKLPYLITLLSTCLKITTNEPMPVITFFYG